MISRGETSVAALALLFVISGCTGKQAAGPPASGETLQVASGPLDDTVAVQLGRRALTRDRSLQLMYVRLVSESRCPANAICVWQGDAAVRVSVAVVGASVDTTIHTTLDPKVLDVRGNLISLVDVQPYPGTGDGRGQPYIVARVVRK